jgi:hypothetical protein
MDFDVLPGPSLPELARTALARAAAATISGAGPAGCEVPPGQVPVRAGRDGSPLLLPATRSLLGRWLAACPQPVTVGVPAAAPFSSLRLTGETRPVARDSAAGVSACMVDLRSIEFAGRGSCRVPLQEYRVAAPDPLWRIARGVLRHLERRHMADLVGCVRAHGMAGADWVIPSGLDRYGLELTVLATDGIAAVRLSFPGGPVTSLRDVPASIRTVLTCRCQDTPGSADEPCGRRPPRRD